MKIIQYTYLILIFFLHSCREGKQNSNSFAQTNIGLRQLDSATFHSYVLNTDLEISKANFEIRYSNSWIKFENNEIRYYFFFTLNNNQVDSLSAFLSHAKMYDFKDSISKIWNLRSALLLHYGEDYDTVFISRSGNLFYRHSIFSSPEILNLCNFIFQHEEKEVRKTDR